MRRFKLFYGMPGADRAPGYASRPDEVTHVQAETEAEAIRTFVADRPGAVVRDVQFDDGLSKLSVSDLTLLNEPVRMGERRTTSVTKETWEEATRAFTADVRHQAANAAAHGYYVHAYKDEVILITAPQTLGRAMSADGVEFRLTEAQHATLFHPMVRTRVGANVWSDAPYGPDGETRVHRKIQSDDAVLTVVEEVLEVMPRTQVVRSGP